jgi:hypothetical protein
MEWMCVTHSSECLKDKVDHFWVPLTAFDSDILYLAAFIQTNYFYSINNSVNKSMQERHIGGSDYEPRRPLGSDQAKWLIMWMKAEK